MTIQIAKEEELDEIFKIFIDKELWLKNNKINQWINYTKRNTKKKLLQEIRNNSTYVLKYDNKIVAVANVHYNNDEFWENLSGNNAFIKNLASVKSGCGKKLMLEIEKLLKEKGIDNLCLDCRADNQFLNNYYLSLGFIEVESDLYYASSKAKANLYQKKL